MSNKTVVDRIVYYTRKVAQAGAVHPSKGRNPYRHARLMAYKAEMHRKISTEELCKERIRPRLNLNNCLT